MTSPFKDIGVSKADITAIYKHTALSHDIPLIPKKYKKDVRDAIYDGGMAVSICKNGKIGVLRETRNDWNCNYYAVYIFDQGVLIDTFSGPISSIMSYFPTGIYYAYDTTVEENKPRHFKRSENKKLKDTKTIDIEKFIEDVKKRVRPLLENALRYRGDELAAQIKAVIEEANEDGYDIKKTKDSYYSISKIDIYEDEDFDLMISNFKKVASLYKKEELDKHLDDVIYTLIRVYFGESPAVSIYSSRKEFITSDFKTDNRRALVLKSSEKVLNNNMQGEHCWGDPEQPKPRVYGSMVRDISFNVVWFYKRLIDEDREVKFWPYSDAGPREVR